ncbi:GNAT family acetyltransferase [Comamonas piscis]|uniref:GNAT family acetyltransferase n=1 Tax=Comamonas piscis TaxID=1562974 RepID=A0A7G5EJY8_9BURK|nr:GNAT family acetyltransferase [Comamonas piscis]QMV74313.1 GNAT family acetyltransferase [Comamonas piscis]WSO32759.1 GNAT family acetyltransferase [Comamonas piscis]
MEIRVFALQDSDEVVQLWHDCGLYRPWNDPHKDIARKLSVSPALFWVGVDARGEVMASIMVGYDGHRGWINYLAVHPSQQRKGYAGQLMQRAEAELTALGCPKLNLQVRVGNEAVIAFYESQGYSNDQTVSLGKRLIADT